MQSRASQFNSSSLSLGPPLLSMPTVPAAVSTLSQILRQSRGVDYRAGDESRWAPNSAWWTSIAPIRGRSTISRCNFFSDAR